jgi:hypothetical protein
MLEAEQYKHQITIFFDNLINIKMRISENYKQEVTRFFSDFSVINDIYLKTKRESDRYLSSDYNVFDFLLTNENALSDYIAMILNSKGAHGQGKLFQTLFITFINEKAKLSLPEIRYKVVREYYANGRIDIFLHSHDTAIIIENKPYATDGQDQLMRYEEYVHPKFKNVFILYLGDGGDPSEYSVKKDLLNEWKNQKKIICLSLHQFGSEYLNNCIMMCESQKFRYFLDDFKSFLIFNFPNNSEVKTNGQPQ